MDALKVYFIFNLFLFIMGGYLFVKATPDLMKKREYTIFKIFIGAFESYILFNSLWTMQEYEVINLPKALFSVVCLLSLSAVLFNCLCFYKFTMIYFGYSSKKRLYDFFGFLPFIVIIIMLLISLGNKMVFYVEDGKIVQGPLYFGTFICAIIYFGIILVSSIVEMFRKKSPQAKRNCLTLLLLVVFLVAWVFLDDYLDGLTIIPIAIFGVLLVLFTTFQQSSINTDALTQMNNRRKAIEYLASQLQNVSVSNPLYLYLLDINLFKDINDKYGHLEGDNALVILSDSIKEIVGGGFGFAARYGGDEFIIAIRPEVGAFNESEIINRIDNICKSKCILLKKPYEIAISYGCVCCTDSSLPVETYFKEVDDLLYQHKRRRKE